MPIIDIVVRNIDTQMFDVVLDENTYKQLTFEPGVLGTKKIVLAIKKFNVSTREDLLLRECEYQRKIRPLLNHKFSLDMLTWGIKNQNRMSD